MKSLDTSLLIPHSESADHEGVGLSGFFPNHYETNRKGEMMAIEWGAVLGGLRIIKDKAEKNQDPKFNEAYLDLQLKIMEIQEDYIRITGENDKLKKANELTSKVSFKRPYIFIEGDPEPYCQRCYDDEGKIIRLLRRERHGSADWSRKCPKCESRFYEGDNIHHPGAQMPSRARR